MSVTNPNIMILFFETMIPSLSSRYGFQCYSIMHPYGIDRYGLQLGAFLPCPAGSYSIEF